MNFTKLDLSDRIEFGLIHLHFKQMKERILKNWTLTRALFLVLGTIIIIQSILSQQWFGILFGSYFASMGLFSFGCAAGNCYGGSCAVETKKSSETQK
ncbi:hypothetical protein Fluta_2866 [Fluviicola taffensis DSM 16823]|uniref:Uncharacterized protein n=2 Tax=Fluviicola TaxID=332102 RepID=F2IHR7_FLUTR|nr:hypothetical protein Fluta_2866 [Fluviicola taffensis DSM 16823]